MHRAGRGIAATDEQQRDAVLEAAHRRGWDDHTGETDTATITWLFISCSLTHYSA